MFNLYALEKSIIKHIEAAQVPGLALAIVQGQEIIHARGYGVTSVEDGGLAVTPRTLFRIGSTTKALTGTALMRLVEAGLLELDRPIKDYLDWLILNSVGAAEKVTLRMLMSHTAGLPDDSLAWEQRDPAGLEAFMRVELPHYPLVAAPGKLFSYSNLGLMLAGCIMQKAYGKPFAQVVQEIIFEPLAMQRSTFDPAIAMTYPLAQAHSARKNGKLAVEHHFVENTAGYPAGFAISTVLDMANFASMHLNQGCFQSAQILSAASIASMHSAQAQLFTRKDLAYGLTFSLEDYRGKRIVGHDGAISSFGCQFTLLPDDKTGIVLLYNYLELDGVGIVHNILDRLLTFPKRTPHVKLHASARTYTGRAYWPLYVGTYLSLYVGLVKVNIVAKQLTLEMNGERAVLKAQRKDLYIGTWEGSDIQVSAGFVVEEGGGPAQYIVVNPYGDDAIFHLLECTRLELPTPELSATDDWLAFAGTYTHKDLGTYTLSIEDGECLLVAQETGEKVLCTAVGTRQFVCQWGLFELQSNADKSVQAIVHKGHMQTLQRVLAAPIQHSYSRS